MQITVRTKDQFKTSLWSGGTTTELYIYPEDAVYKEGNFQCRISSATVEVERSEFTSLPGVKRYLSIFSGNLKMIHGEEIEVNLKPYEVDRFDGGTPTVSFGKVVDFNLMLKNGGDGKMETALLNPGEILKLQPEEGENLLAVYVKEGKIKVEEDSAEKEELVLVRGWDRELVLKGEQKAGIAICRVKVTR